MTAPDTDPQPTYSAWYILGLSSSNVAAQLSYGLSIALLDPLMTDMK
jgi:hypothetical protein